MSLIVLGSGRSPGLTTATHALALAWPPPRRSLIAELDPDGGSLAGRHAISSDPGLVSLAAAGRRDLSGKLVLEHCRPLVDGCLTLVGPASPDRAASALATLGGRLGAALDAVAGFDVLADCGRLESRSPVLEMLTAAPVVVLVVEPSVEGIAHLAARLSALPVPAGRTALVCVGHRPYAPAEVASALNLPVLGVLARDRRGATHLAEGRPNRRSPLLRSAAAVAAELVRHLPPIDIEAPTDAPAMLPSERARRVMALPDSDPLGGQRPEPWSR